MLKLANFFNSLGWTRDDAKWVWGQIVSIAALIVSNVFDVHYWAGYIGINLSVTELHVITVVATAVLWLSGKMNSSNLNSKAAMQANPELKNEKLPEPPKPLENNLPKG